MADQQKTLDIVWGVIGTKDAIEAIFKNFTWFVLCGTLLRFVPAALAADKYVFASAAFITSICLIFVNFRYGLVALLLPVDRAVGEHLNKLKDQNKKADQSDGMRVKRVLSFLFGTKIGISYFAIGLAYVLFAFELMGMVSSWAK